MSCQSLTTPVRPFAEPDKENMTHCGSIHRSVRFSSESRCSTRKQNDFEFKRDASGCISLTSLAASPGGQQGSLMSHSAPAPSTAIDLDDVPAPMVPSCRFPKLEECAHFHYERVALGGVRVETVPCTDDEPCPTHTADTTDHDEGWICLKVRSHVNDPEPLDVLEVSDKSLQVSWTSEVSDVCEWSLTRSAHNFLQLDDMLHRCIYDRKVSGLLNLSEEINARLLEDRPAYESLISDYVHHLSIIADDTINCGPILNWLQMDNKGHKLLVANEDSSSINTPAVAAAYSVRKYVSQARDEISFEVGDMISIIDMPGPQESVWWRGKRGFRVGFFPHHCVAVIGDKVPRHMTQPPPIVGSVAVAPIKPVLRKHGKLISLFRSFILSRPSRRSLKQQGILRERVFGCDLGEHLLNCGHDVPLVLVECARVIEARGAVDGIYRLSGGSGLTQRLRAAFDEGSAPPLEDAAVARDPHALASLLKMYFRELPNPLCTYQLYESFVCAVQSGPDETVRLKKMRDTVVKLPPPHYRTLSYLMRHLRRVSLLGDLTGMTARNMAIVWAPNLLRSPHSQHALQGVAVQAVVTEFLICYAEDLFSSEQGAAEGDDGEEDTPESSLVTVRCGQDASRRPKSLPPNPPTKLLSLEEARRRGKCASVMPPAPIVELPSPSGLGAQLRPSSSLRPKYIEVGSGPNNLPQYHTVLELPITNKRGLKRSPSGWRGLFSRSKYHRPRPTPRPTPPTTPTVSHPHLQDDVPMVNSPLRPVKSCESLQSETDTLPPLNDNVTSQLKSHTRSASCDSYFEPWQVELADMRLRLSPQERDGNIFSEEDDTTLNVLNGIQGGSLCSSPVCSDSCSVEPSPRRVLTLQTHVDNCDRKRNKIEEQLSNIGFIDGTDSPVRLKPGAEKRHSDEWPTQPNPLEDAKRVCKDRDSPLASLDFMSSGLVKLRERNSPRKSKNSCIRYSGLHQPLNLTDAKNPNSAHNQPRMSWHGTKEHSTLIKIDWPIENSSSITHSTFTSSSLTPTTPIYDRLETDSEPSETNKQTIRIEKECENCASEKKCLKCELKECPDYQNVNADFKIGQPVKPFGMTLTDEQKSLHDSLEHSPLTEVSYQNLNRLSAVSTNSSNSDPHFAKKADPAYENVAQEEKGASIMTSSHESSSSYSNVSNSKHDDDLYECYSFSRPNYINLQSSSTSKSSSTSPVKSPLRSTISITFKSPTKSTKSMYEALHTPTNDERDSVYEDLDLDKNLSIVEDASVPDTDASLPTQQACQPNFNEDLIILETPTEHLCPATDSKDGADVYSQVKFFRKSVDEVNALVLESPEKCETSAYENVPFPSVRDIKRVSYENIELAAQVDDMTKYDDAERKAFVNEKHKANNEYDNGNVLKHLTTNLNVRQLANKFESPTEQKGPFGFDKYKTSTVERKIDEKNTDIPKKEFSVKIPLSPKTTKSSNARSLDENAFVKEFGGENTPKRDEKYEPDLNLNINSHQQTETTPTTENKISLIQRFDEKNELANNVNIEIDNRLSRERIEKYKEERRNFLREKYSSQSFRTSNPVEHLKRIKVKKPDDNAKERLHSPKFERRNTVDLGKNARFSLARSANNLDNVNDAKTEVGDEDGLEILNDDCMTMPGTHRKFDSAPRSYDRKEKISPSFHIKDMAAMFEQKSQSGSND